MAGIDGAGVGEETEGAIVVSGAGLVVGAEPVSCWVHAKKAKKVAVSIRRQNHFIGIDSFQVFIRIRA